MAYDSNGYFIVNKSPQRRRRFAQFALPDFAPIAAAIAAKDAVRAWDLLIVWAWFRDPDAPVWQIAKCFSEQGFHAHELPRGAEANFYTGTVQSYIGTKLKPLSDKLWAIPIFSDSHVVKFADALSGVDLRAKTSESIIEMKREVSKSKRLATANTLSVSASRDYWSNWNNSVAGKRGTKPKGLR